MREKLTIVKVGGKIVEEDATLYKLLDDFAAIEGYKLLVHGDGFWSLLDDLTNGNAKMLRNELRQFRINF